MSLRSDFLCALLVAILVLSPVIVIVQPTQASVSATSGATSSPLDFPYYYQQPSVPSNIGAQGAQGPTVPLSQIGVTGQVGSSGHIGPVNTTNPYSSPSGVASRAEFHVLDGTTSNSVNSNRANVYLVNITSGQNLTGTTNAQGYLNLTITEGWYYVKITPAVYGSEINYEKQTLITSASSLLTRYLLPKGGSTIAINTKGTSGTVWFSETTNQGVLSQLNVTILNESAGGSPLGSGNTANNGSIEFTNVNTAYSYAFRVNGYNNPSNGVRYYLGNSTTSSRTFSGRVMVVADSSMSGVSLTSGTLSGAPLPTGNAPWSLTSSTSVVGGKTYISAPMQFSTGVTLTFTNALIYFNSTLPASSSPASIRFSNSTVYFIAEGAQTFSAARTTQAVMADHTLFFGIGDNSLPVSDRGLMIGFANVSNSLFYYMNSNYLGALFGNYYNDVILNSTAFPVAVDNVTHGGNGLFDFQEHLYFSHVSVINSILFGGAEHFGNFNIYRSMLSNSTTKLAFLRINATEFLLNMTPQTNFDRFDSHWLNMSHSDIIFSTPQNETFIQYANTIPSDNFANPPGAGSWLQSVSFSNAASGMGIGKNNITYTYFGRTYPSVNLTFTFGGFQGETQLYNDWINFNWSWNQFSQAMSSYYTNNVGGVWPSYSQTVPFTDGQAVFQSWGQISVNYTRCDMGGNNWFQIYSHMTSNHGVTSYWEHDVFPWTQIVENQYSPFVLFPGNDPGQIDISNTTFGYIYWNWTAWVPGNNQEGEAMVWMDTATNQNLQPPPYINITHDTFEAPSFGAGSNGMAGIVQFAKWGIIGTVSYCRFMNSPDYVVNAPDISNASDYRSWYLPPHQDDILASASNVTIHDNWFLNLTNLTMPIGSDQSYQNGGWGGNTTEYNNHFFYYPLPGMSYINETWGFSNVGYYGSPTPSVHGQNINGFNGSHLSYEIPVGQQASMRVLNGGNYVYNSSINQLPPSHYVVNDKGWQNGMASQWSWIIEPDFVWNGSAYVAIFQGMGGPQPNLTFQGHVYSWAFEPNRTYISADSLNAPSIPLAFSIPNPARMSGTAHLYYYNYSSGRSSLLESVALSSSGNEFSILYKPSVYGTRAIFWVNSTIVGVLPPADFAVTFHEKGLPSGTAWNVLLGGASKAASEANITFTEPNGSYNFTVSKILGYYPSVPSGTIFVNGSNVNITINFAKAVYKVTFVASGLSGEVWAVNLDNSTQQSSSGSIVFYEPNGTYSYTITPPVNYTASSIQGIVSVVGQDINVTLSFNITLQQPPPQPPPNPPAKNSPPILFAIGSFRFNLYDMLLTIAVVALIGVSANLHLRRKRK